MSTLIIRNVPIGQGVIGKVLDILNNLSTTRSHLIYINLIDPLDLAAVANSNKPQIYVIDEDITIDRVNLGEKINGDIQSGMNFFKYLEETSTKNTKE